MSTPQAQWEELVRTALIGTERRALTITPMDDSPLGRVLTALEDRPVESKLLSAAAVLPAYRQAGALPPRDDRPLPSPCPAPTGAPCPPAAAVLLRQLLLEPLPELVPEWLDLAVQHSVRVPEELLPLLLDFGRRRAHLRERIATAVGERGQWLATQRDEWAYAASITDPAAVWQIGTFELRLRVLRQLRASDADAGLELLRSTWEQEAPRERAAFLALLAEGLNERDEPFLEAALDDRRKEVRDTAARLLARLPSSQLVARMTERVAPRLEWITPEGILSRLRGNREQIRVELPVECDAAMRRDGIEPKPADRTGERAWWMLQMLGAVPPSLWTARWRTDATGCIEAARRSDDQRRLLTGWATAAVSFRDAAWAESLLDAGVVEDRSHLIRLATVLPPQRLEERIQREIRAQGRLRSDEPVFPLLLGATHPWSPTLTRSVLEYLPPEPGQIDWNLREACRTFASRMHPATAAEVLRRQGEPHTAAWIELLHHRITLHEAFRS